tara:strand:+ start:1993 stop:2364 length:372 start_codon:yes stop_codon:yes gene_type:complete
MGWLRKILFNARIATLLDLDKSWEDIQNAGHELESRVSSDESWTQQVPNRIIRERTEEPVTELAFGSYAWKLEKNERNKRSRTTRLSEQHEGMGREHKEISIIPDPWIDYESTTTTGSLEERW